MISKAGKPKPGRQGKGGKRYSLLIAKAAERDLRKLKKKNPRAARRIGDALRHLKVTPFDGDVKKLSGKDEAIFRLRVDSFRILYTVDGYQLIVLVLRVGDRKSIY